MRGLELASQTLRNGSLEANVGKASESSQLRTQLAALQFQESTQLLVFPLQGQAAKRSIYLIHAADRPLCKIADSFRSFVLTTMQSIEKTD